MQIHFNGTPQHVHTYSTLENLLEKNGISSSTTGIAIALNELIIPREAWIQTALQPGDTIEIVQAVYGG